MGKKFLEVVLKLSGDTVTISTNDTDAEIFSEGAKFNLLIFNADDFPEIKIDDTLQKINLRKSAFKNLIRKTAFSASKDDDGRKIFTGVLFDIGGENLTLAATDAHRLAVSTEKLSEPIDGELKFIVPAKILQDISQMIDDYEKIEICYAVKKVSFTFDNLFVTARVIEGQFPPYERVIPKENPIIAHSLNSNNAAAMRKPTVTIRFIYK